MAEPGTLPAPGNPPSLSVALLQRILDRLDVLAVVADADGRVVTFNRAAERVTGYEARDAVGRPMGELLLGQEPGFARMLLDVLRRIPGPLRQELAIRTRAGETRIVAWSAELLADEAGGPPMLIATGVDVTERRRLEEEARDRERALRLIVDAGPIGIARVDRNRVFTFVNEAYAAFYGMRPEDLVGRSGETLLPPERVARILPHVDAVLSGLEQTYETRVPNAAGEMRTMQVRMVPDRDGTGAITGFFTFGLDVTDAAEARSRASQLERQLLDAIEHSTGAVMITDPDDRVALWNRAYEEMFPHQVPLQAGTPFIEVLRRAVDRSVVHSHPSEQWIEARMAAHRNADKPFIYEMGDGRWLLCVESVMHDGGRMAITLDITEQKRAEQELARSNQELQQFASAASHDLQEPLRKVQAFGKLLADRYGDRLDATGRDYLARMVDAANRMRILIDDVLRYSRVGTGAEPFRPIDLNAVMRGVLADLEVAIGEADARIEVEPLPWIEADAGQLRQVFQNLLGNALKYRARDRQPLIKVTAERRDTSLVIRVADNGIGFEPEYAERIFGIFQRLHPRDEYPGTGVGLALCRKVIERHRGTITATGEPGVGATFEITLPARQGGPEGRPGIRGEAGGRRRPA